MKSTLTGMALVVGFYATMAGCLLFLSAAINGSLLHPLYNTIAATTVYIIEHPVPYMAAPTMVIFGPLLYVIGKRG